MAEIWAGTNENLDLRAFYGATSRPPPENSLLFSLLAGNSRGERFAVDCSHRQRGHELSLVRMRRERRPFHRLFRARNNHHAPHNSAPISISSGAFGALSPG